MDTLPSELLQIINDYLEFVDQINFKSSCKWNYEKVQIKQIIPYLMIRENIYLEHQCDSRHSYIALLECVQLNKLHIRLPEYIKNWSIWHDSYNICVMSPNKYNKISCKKSLFDEIRVREPFDYNDLKRVSKIEFYDDFPQNTKIRYYLTDFELFYCSESNELSLNDEPFNLKTFVMKCLEIFNDNETI